MTTGPKVSTGTFLSPNIELQGWVYTLDDNMQPGTPLGERDHFDLLPDPPFNAIMGVVPGNGYISCIARLPDNTLTNVPDPGDLPELPPGTRLTKLSFGATNDLLVGDHVRLRGHLWLVHDPNLFPVNEDNGLRYSQTHLVLQPFAWDKIEEIDPFPAITGAGDGSLGVVAPLFRHRYLEGFDANVTQGVDGHIFLAEDGSNFDNEIPAVAQFDAPPLTNIGFQPDALLVSYEESLLPNSAVPDGNVVVRQTIKNATGIEVQVMVKTAAGAAGGGPAIADVDHPLAFAAHYRVRWSPRIIPEQNSYQLNGFLKQQTINAIHVFNRGIETLLLTNLRILQDPDNTLQLLTPINTSLPGRPNPQANAPGVTEIQLLFSPPYPIDDPIHHVDAILEVTTNDPVGQPIQIELVADPVKDPKEIKDDKEAKEAKDTKEAKEQKETKEAQDKQQADATKQNKDNKDAKENKERKETKDRKELKERKETKDDPKPEHKRETKELAAKEIIEQKRKELAKELIIEKNFIQDRSKSVVKDATDLSSSISPNHEPILGQPGLPENPGAQEGPRHKVFIRAAERPALGERALRQPRRKKPDTPPAPGPAAGDRP